MMIPPIFCSPSSIRETMMRVVQTVLTFHAVYFRVKRVPSVRLALVEDDC